VRPRQCFVSSYVLHRMRRSLAACLVATARRQRQRRQQQQQRPLNGHPPATRLMSMPVSTVQGRQREASAAPRPSLGVDVNFKWRYAGIHQHVKSAKPSRRRRCDCVHTVHTYYSHTIVVCRYIVPRCLPPSRTDIAGPNTPLDVAISLPT